MRFFSTLRPARLAALLLPLAVIAGGCQLPRKNTHWDVPYTLKTFPPDYASHVTEITDANKDGQITLVEWTNAGGDRRSFELADTNKDGVVTRTELLRVGSTVRFFDFTQRYADVNNDDQLTPREFRSSRQTQVLRIEF